MELAIMSRCCTRDNPAFLHRLSCIGFPRHVMDAMTSPGRYARLPSRIISFGNRKLQQKIIGRNYGRYLRYKQKSLKMGSDRSAQPSRSTRATLAPAMDHSSRASAQRWAHAETHSSSSASVKKSMKRHKSKVHKYRMHEVDAGADGKYFFRILIKLRFALSLPSCVVSIEQKY